VGGSALRAGALSDPDIIHLVNTEFVPVWVNVREDSLPDVPILKEVLLHAELDEDRHIHDLFSKGFFLRSLVLSPDGQTLLNPQAKTPQESVANFSEKGYFAYAQVKPMDYRVMLEGSLRRYEARP